MGDDHRITARSFSGFFLGLALLCGAMLANIPRSDGAPQTVKNGAATSEDPWTKSSGKVVVLIFVRTDCPIANRYAPEIARLSEARAGDAAFWMVYPDKKESSEEVRKHQSEFHLTLPVLRDPQNVLIKRGQVSVTPEAAVFDAKGRLVYHGRIDNWFGDFGRARPAATTHELSDAIAAALSGHPETLPSMPAVGCYLSDVR
jgi:hypothetical protein